MTPRLLFFVVLAMAVLLVSSAHAQSRAGAKALEARLYAPCCYGGTLDVHESEMARDLRKEIESRLEKGESADAIQADFVARYSERVIAARSDRPIAIMGVLVLAVILFAAAFVARMVVRWRSAGPIGAEPLASVGAPRDDLDERLDAELREVDP